MLENTRLKREVLKMTEFAFLDATAQAELIRRKEVSSEELVSSAIERIEAFNPVLNAVIHPLYEQARETARAPVPGPFSGVPFLVKDLTAEVEGPGGRFRFRRRALCFRQRQRTGAALQGSRAGHTRQDQYFRVRAVADHRTGTFRPDAQSLGYQPGAGRLERRVGCGRGCGHGPGGTCQ
jgi:hypothetical protein